MDFNYKNFNIFIIKLIIFILYLIYNKQAIKNTHLKYRAANIFFSNLKIFRKAFRAYIITTFFTME